jgi:hypothetical protein
VALVKEDREACVDIVESCKTAHFLTREERANFHLAYGKIVAVAAVLVRCPSGLWDLGKQQAIVDLVVTPS